MMLTFTFMIRIYVCGVTIWFLGGFLIVVILFSGYVVRFSFGGLVG